MQKYSCDKYWLKLSRCFSFIIIFLTSSWYYGLNGMSRGYKYEVLCLSRKSFCEMFFWKQEALLPWLILSKSKAGDWKHGHSCAKWSCEQSVTRRWQRRRVWQSWYSCSLQGSSIRACSLFQRAFKWVLPFLSLLFSFDHSLEFGIRILISRQKPFAVFALHEMAV